MDVQRQLLAELMDPLIPSQRKDFRDDNVCKNHLVAFCPNELFMNTKVDLGRCTLIHEDKLALDYRQSQLRGTLGYEYNLNEQLLKLANDVERNIKKGHQRLGNSKLDLPPQCSQDEVREKVITLQALADPKLEALEHFGRLGRVKEAQEMYLALERIYAELDLVRQDDVTHPSYRPDKNMDLCLVCGAFLANDTTGMRIDQHMVGKQHTGFLKIREALEIFKRNPPLKVSERPASPKAEEEYNPRRPPRNYANYSRRPRDRKDNDRRRY